jgi:hypothetical protein
MKSAKKQQKTSVDVVYHHRRVPTMSDPYHRYLRVPVMQTVTSNSPSPLRPQQKSPATITSKQTKPESSQATITSKHTTAVEEEEVQSKLTQPKPSLTGGKQDHKTLKSTVIVHNRRNTEGRNYISYSKDRSFVYCRFGSERFYATETNTSDTIRIKCSRDSENLFIVTYKGPWMTETKTSVKRHPQVTKTYRISLKNKRDLVAFTKIFCSS